MKCKNCNTDSLIRKGMRGIKQRYQCKTCGKHQQSKYTYKLYETKDDFQIKTLNAEGVGIRSMSRITGYSQGTILRRLSYLASLVTRPIYCEKNEVYEVHVPIAIGSGLTSAKTTRQITVGSPTQ